MDLHSIDTVQIPRSRADLAGLSKDDGLIAGGTWMMSEPQMHLRRLVDLRGLGWPDLTITNSGLDIGATCTIETLVSADYPDGWIATPVFGNAARALLASYKIWKNATVGGNICLGFPVGSMISMASALDAELLIWKADGSDLRCTLPEFVTGNATTILGRGDVLRSLTIPAAALSQPTALRKMALSPLGRSGVVVVGRRAPGGMVISVTAATIRPYVVVTDSLDPSEVAGQVDSAIPPDAYFSDPHGAADWRHQVAKVLTREVVVELAGS
jgi:CO/xanthine dehydrogenase FAD-binding subunit